MPRKNKPQLLCSETAKLPTAHGTWQIMAFCDRSDRAHRQVHLALWRGRIRGQAKVLTRIHSECLTSEVLGSLKCDCAEQLQLAMRRIRRRGSGLILYLRQEGRGIGLFNKIRAYHLQDWGHDTVDANRALGLPDDVRDYAVAAAWLKQFGVKSVRLMSNNPKKISALEAAGVAVADTSPLRTKPHRHNRGYLMTKKQRMGHRL